MTKRRTTLGQEGAIKQALMARLANSADDIAERVSEITGLNQERIDFRYISGEHWLAIHLLNEHGGTEEIFEVKVIKRR